MINLLPLQYKKELWQIEKQKITAILGSVFLLSLFCLILILFSIKIWTDGQVAIQKIFISIWEREFLEAEIEELQKKVELANQTLAGLASFYQKEFSFSKTVEEIVKIVAPGTRLNSLSFGSLAKDGVEVSLSGFAPDRETLLTFKNNLENSLHFKDIYFPASNWVKPTDIDFFVSFKAVR